MGGGNRWSKEGKKERSETRIVLSVQYVQEDIFIDWVGFFASFPSVGIQKPASSLLFLLPSFHPCSGRQKVTIKLLCQLSRVSVFSLPNPICGIRSKWVKTQKGR